MDGTAVGGGTAGFAVAPRTAEPAASRDSGRPTVGAQRTGTPGDTGRAALPRPGGEPAPGTTGTTATGPLAATGSEGAVLIPIAAGLLLTGAAMYKHRGLPRGH